jgi:hypothetical protein
VNGPKRLTTPCGLQRRRRAGGAQEGGHLFGRVRQAPGRHRRGLLAPAPERRQQAFPDAHQAIRREQDEADEQQAEPQLPAVGMGRQPVAEQDVEHRTDGGAEEIARAADHRHGEDLARGDHVDQIGRDEIHQIGEEAAAQAGDRARRW